MTQDMVTPNETLQLNELLALKSLSLTKSLLMSPMITDPHLKAIMKRDTETCEGHIKELRSFMEKSTVTSSHNANFLPEDRGNEI